MGSSGYLILQLSGINLSAGLVRQYDLTVMNSRMHPEAADFEERKVISDMVWLAARGIDVVAPQM
jgi:hypothetical protein